MRLLITTGILVVMSVVPIAAQNAITLSEAYPSSGNHIPLDGAIDFRLRVQIDTSYPGGLWVYNNCFRIYSPDGAAWDTIYARYLPGWLPFGERSYYYSNNDGIGADTVTFYGEDSAGGFFVVYDQVAWSIIINLPDDPSLSGKTICLDTVSIDMEYFGSSWVWASLFESYVPSWDGPHCFTIGCCNTDGIRGDVDYDGNLNVADINWAVHFLFTGGPPPPCFNESDVNDDNRFDVGDLSYLIDYLFKGGQAPEPCP